METKIKKQHTPGPWKLGTAVTQKALGIFQDSVQDGQQVDAICLITPLDCLTEQDQINAKRIVECVNACEGLDNPAEFIQEYEEALKKSVDGILQIGTKRLAEAIQASRTADALKELYDAFNRTGNLTARQVKALHEANNILMKLHENGKL